jgi:hypothetical protein
MQAPLNHFTTPDFWSLYHRLAAQVRRTADKYFALLKLDPRHPSLNLKKIGDIWSFRAGYHYRSIGMDAPYRENRILWFWIGSHAEDNRLIKQKRVRVCLSSICP